MYFYAQYDALFCILLLKTNSHFRVLFFTAHVTKTSVIRSAMHLIISRFPVTRQNFNFSGHFCYTRAAVNVFPSAARADTYITAFRRDVIKQRHHRGDT